MTDDAPPALYTAQQVRELDRRAIEEHGIDAYGLMSRAGAAAFAALATRWPAAGRVAVLCGPGNNGGDGYVIARLARERGLVVDLYPFADPQALEGAAGRAWEALAAAGVQPRGFEARELSEADVVVDALLGTGLTRPVQGRLKSVIEAVNRCGVPVLAVDIPSGLAADTGNPLGAAVQAACTVTFIGRKRGLYTAAGPDYAGTVVFASLDLPAGVYAGVSSRVLLNTGAGTGLGPRARSAHKGMNGHVLVVGGDAGTVGAVRMAGEAALRTGAGLVSIATRTAHATLLAAVRPELMPHGVEDVADLRPLLERATVVALGPGLGQGAWGRLMLQTVLGARQPLVVDADGLNLLARQPRTRENWVLTPHPGEAGRLLGCGAGEVQQDRFAAVRRLSEGFGAVAVLKGAGTLVHDTRGAVTVCARGNPGMASGGMGDVLTGVIAALMAQGLDPAAAARAGVCVHGAAGDRAARAGERGLLAGDLIGELRELVNA